LIVANEPALQWVSIPADAAGDFDVLVTNFPSFVPQCILDRILVFGLPQHVEDPVDGPPEIDRSWPGGGKLRGGVPDEFGTIGPVTTLECCKIQAPCRGRADQWRPAHQHLFDRMLAVAPEPQILDDVIMREAALIDDLHHLWVVRLLPDGPKFLARSPHRTVLLQRTPTGHSNARRQTGSALRLLLKAKYPSQCYSRLVIR
jgi:hypothetical protein